MASEEMKSEKAATTAIRAASEQVTVQTHIVNLRDVDKAAKFLAGTHGEVTAEESRRIRRKIDRHLLPMMMIMYFVQFTDKTTLGASSILGIKQDNHLSQEQYNWLATIFYVAYIIFVWPQSIALQKFRPGKWLSANILAWSVVLYGHAGCSSFAGLFVCRFFLGVCESSITAGFLLMTSMFYTHAEATRRVSYWALMNGTAQIFSGLVSFGVYHMNRDIIHPWRLFMIITGSMTLVVGVCFWVWFPDNPMTAHFLSEEEKIIAIERLRNQSTGIENKTWKAEQFWEAMTDWKPWAFFAYSALGNVSNSLTNMTQLIIESFGFTTKQTTLLACVPGVIEILTLLTSVLVMKRYPNSRAYVASWYSLPAIIAGVLLVSLPFSAKGALLFAMYFSDWAIPSFVIALSWCAATHTGHTKKTTANAMQLIGYCLGNLLSPHMWQDKYAPRYYLPWGIILATYVINPAMLLGIRYFLNNENKRRDALGHEKVDKFYDEHGNEVDPTFVDVSDRKNMAFRYPL